MRAAPATMVGTSVHHTTELARRSAAVTHAHKHGQHGAACQAAAAYLALHSDPARPLAVSAFLHDLAPVVRSAPWHDKFDRVAELARRRSHPEHACRALGHDASALDSVPAALLAFVTYPIRADEAIRFAVRVGGDADSDSITAMAGARTGTESLPGAWLRRLEKTGRLRAVADRLT